MSRLRRYLAAALLLALAAACAGPLGSVLTDQQLAPAPTLAVAQPLEATVAEAVAATTATALPETTAAAATATLAPLPLAAHVPLAVWDNNGEHLSLLPIDPRTGAVFEAAALTDLGSSYLAAYAPDGRTLALLIFEAQAVTGAIRFVDLTDWTISAPRIALVSYPSAMLFTPDGHSLLVAGASAPDLDPEAVANGTATEGDPGLNELVRYAVATGAEQARASLPFAPRSVSLAPDGQSVLVYGAQAERDDGLNPAVSVAQLDLATLTVQWQQALPAVRDGQYAAPAEIGAQELWATGQWYSPAVVWSPSAPVLYLVHAGDDALTTVDFAAQTVTTVPVAPAQSWLDRLMAATAGVAEAKMLNGTTMQAVLSPDGQRLYALGFRVETVKEYTETPLGLRVIDVATGALLDTVETGTRNLTLGADPAGAPVLVLEGWHDRYWSEVRALADPHTVLGEFRYVGLLTGRTPDGARVWLAREDRAQRTVFHVIDPATWTDLGQWPAAGFAQPLLLP